MKHGRSHTHEVPEERTVAAPTAREILKHQAAVDSVARGRLTAAAHIAVDTGQTSSTPKTTSVIPTDQTEFE